MFNLSLCSREKDDGQKTSGPVRHGERSHMPRDYQSPKTSHPAPRGADVTVCSETTEPNKASHLELTDDDIDNLELSEECCRLTVLGPGCIEYPQFPAMPLPSSAPYDFGSESSSASSSPDIESSSLNTNSSSPDTERSTLAAVSLSLPHSLEFVDGSPGGTASSSSPSELTEIGGGAAGSSSSSDIEVIRRAEAGSAFEMIAPVRLRLWLGESKLLEEPVLGGAVYLTTSRLFRVWDDELRRQLAVPLSRIAGLRYDECERGLEIVCKDESTFSLEFFSIPARNIWVDVLDQKLHRVGYMFTGPLSQLLLPPSSDPEKQLSELRSAFFSDNELEAIGPLRKRTPGPASCPASQRARHRTKELYAVCCPVTYEADSDDTCRVRPHITTE